MIDLSTKYDLMILFIDFFLNPCYFFCMEVSMDIGGRIKELRRLLGYKQFEFAKEIGIKQTALSLIETGKNALTEQNIKLICLAFCVNESWLRFGKGEMFVSDVKEDTEQRRFIALFEQLNADMQGVVIKHLEELVATQETLGTKDRKESND